MKAACENANAKQAAEEKRVYKKIKHKNFNIFNSRCLRFINASALSYGF